MAIESGENGISVGCVQGCVGLKQPYIDVIHCILTTKIQDAYPDFAKWSADSNNIEWYNNSVADKVVGGGAQ